MFRDVPDLLKRVACVVALLVIWTFLDKSPVEFVAICTAVTFANAALSRLQQRDAKPKCGWSTLTVSLAEWAVAIALFGLTSLFFYVFWFVGSARVDARSQMIALQCLIAAFAVMSAFMAWHSFSSFTRWNEDCVEQYTVLLGWRKIRFEDVVSGRYNDLTGCMTLEARDGSRVYIPLMHNGAQAFMEELEIRCALGRCSSR